MESNAVVFEDFNSSFEVQDVIRTQLKTTKKRNVNFNFFIPQK
jgi:hypothetical protein